MNRRIYAALRVFTTIIAILVFAAGITFTALGGHGLVVALSHLLPGEHIANLQIKDQEHVTASLIAIEMLHAIDLFLIAIVFFVLSLGILILFNKPDDPFPLKLPEWLRIKNLVQLKVILWESILTTLVVAYLARMAERNLQGLPITYVSLIIPGGILLISLALYFLKKGEE